MRDFLIKAKRATYAGNGNEKRLKDGCKELFYKQKSLTYKDKYFGSKQFSGQEIVFSNEKPIWVMNYSGGVKRMFFTSKIYNFLKKALLKIPKNAPFRGPKEFIKGLWKYKNMWKGDIKKFRGKEEIFYKNKLVYELKYQGGNLKRSIAGFKEGQELKVEARKGEVRLRG
jgi:hypothetical protein